MMTMLLVFLLPHGENAPTRVTIIDPEGGTARVDHDFDGLGLAGAIAGQLSFLALFASLALTRGALRRRMRRAMAHLWHLRLGRIVLGLSLLHTVLLLVNMDHRGWLSGTIALAALAGHGATSALKRRWLPLWGTPKWRAVNAATAWTAILFSVEHLLVASYDWGLAGTFERLGWN